MDDLDGVLAGMLNIRSNFGALLDNVCDSIPHAVFVMIVGMHYFNDAANPWIGGLCLASALLATGSIILRAVTRIDPAFATGTGSPTNELIRHIFFIIILSQFFGFDPTPYLIITCFLHAVSMLAPFKIPYMIRSQATSTVAIGAVNVALLVAWLVPSIALFIAVPFVATYLASFATEGIRWLRNADKRKLCDC